MSNRPLCPTNSLPMDDGTNALMRSRTPGSLGSDTCNHTFENVFDTSFGPPGCDFTQRSCEAHTPPSGEGAKTRFSYWSLTPAGKQRGMRFPRGASFFVTLGNHGYEERGLDLVFSVSKQLNCLCYALGSPTDTTVWPKLENDQLFALDSVDELVGKIKGKFCLPGALPLSKPAPSGFFAIDVWRAAGIVKTSSPYHATVRAWHPATGVIIVSKDGLSNPVENFTPASLTGDLRTNAGGNYAGKPAYTMLIRNTCIGDWRNLEAAFKEIR